MDLLLVLGEKCLRRLSHTNTQGCIVPNQKTSKSVLPNCTAWWSTIWWSTLFILSTHHKM